MGKNYVPINLPVSLENFDLSEIVNLSNVDSDKEEIFIDTIDYLLNNLSIEKEAEKDENNFIRNYIYTTITARKHLLEIEERIKEIRKQSNKISNKESYECRKLKHFLNKNEKAKNDITKFLCYDIEEYLREHNNSNYDLINREKEEKLLTLYRPPYDYCFNKEYYDPNYDFSTYVKFCNTPNIGIVESLKNVNSTIVLKEDNPQAYYKKVISTVNDNSLLQVIAERIGKNYHFHKRKEVFETMVTLFNEEKYTTFIITAAIQIEGMFFELVSIRYGNKENQGTLVEKADKTFSKNPQQKHTLYPYFAFDIPELRNKVAHIGLVDSDNIKNLAYELVLDLHCVLTLAEKESLNKFRYLMKIFSNNTNSINPADYAEDNEYYKKVAEHLYFQLSAFYPFVDDSFWGVLTNPTGYDEELDYYLLQMPKQEEGKDKRHIPIKDIVLFYSKMVRESLFWEIVLEHCDDFSEINHTKLIDAGAFTEKLKNMFIPRLSGDAKDLCVAVNKKLQDKKIIN